MKQNDTNNEEKTSLVKSNRGKHLKNVLNLSHNQMVMLFMCGKTFNDMNFLVWDHM